LIFIGFHWFSLVLLAFTDYTTTLLNETGHPIANHQEWVANFWKIPKKKEKEKEERDVSI